jgi:putative addiction module antidote
MITLKVIRIGKSVGVILSEEALAKLGVSNGDRLILTEAAGGCMRLSACNAEVARQIEVGEKIMEEYGESFRSLANAAA